MSRVVPLTLLAILGAAAGKSQTPVPFITTVAGLPTGTSNTACMGDIPTAAAIDDGDGCLPTQASFSAPSSTAVDPYGNLYISDNTHRQLRVVYQGGPYLGAMLIAASPTISNFQPIPGRIYTLAGGIQGVIATTGTPKALYCNSAGSGIVAIASNGDGCPAAQGYIQPRGIAVDAYGNIFFASLGGGEGMRVIYSGGTAAQNPVFTLITTLNSTVTTPITGYLYSITGSSTAGFLGDGANARTARWENVRDVVVDTFGNIYMSDGNSAGSITNNDIRVIYVGGTAVANLITASYPGTTPTYGFLYTIVGAKASANACSGASFSGDGGPAAAAAINSPYAMFLDGNNNLYFTDSCNGRLRVIYTAGTIPNVTNPVAGNIYTVAGGGTLTGGATGVAATQLALTLTQSGGIDAAGNIYLGDNTQRYIWQINPTTGIATVFGGFGTAVTPVKGAFCSGTAGPTAVDGIGDGCPSLQAPVSPSLHITGDSFGRIYSIDNSALRMYSYNNIFPATTVGASTTQPLAFTLSALQTDAFTLGGAATTEFNNGSAATCGTVLTSPSSALCVYNVAFAPLQSGARYGAVQLTSGATTLVTEVVSGVGTAAQLSVDPGTQSALGSGITPQGVAADLSGNLYVADAKAGALVEINIAAKTSATLLTGLNKPDQIAVDGAGNVYVADTGNNRIAKRAVGGGTATSLGLGLAAPQGVAVDGVGNVYIADTGNSRVVEIVAGGTQKVFPISGLSGPTRIIVDANSTLFVVDSGNNRIVEWTAAAGQSVVSFGTASIKPAGIAVDPAGDIYVADLNSLSVIELLPGAAATINTLISSLVTPVDLAVGPDASVYVADTSATSVGALNRSLGAINFPITNIGESSNESILLANTGNSALSFPGPQLATGPVGSPFSIGGASANSCAIGSTVAPSTSCLLNATFTPTTPGSPSQTFNFTTNAANTATAAALLTGTGAHLTSTTTKVSISSPTTSTIGFGTPVVISAVVSLGTNVGTPTGTIKIIVDGQARTPVPYGTGTVTLTLNPTVGTHVVTAQFSGDILYASSSNTLNFTVAQATTATTLGVATSAPSGTPTVTFTATVNSATATGETGTVTFYSGTTQLGQPISLAGSTTVTYATTSIVFPSNSFTAIYSGDGNFQGSTSAALVPPPDFTLATSAASLGIAQGGVASAIITVTPIFSATGTVVPSCSNLPTYAVCRFQPTSVTFSGNSPVSVSINLYTDIAASSISMARGVPSGIALAMLTPFGLGVLGLALFGRKRKAAIAKLMLLAMMALGAMSTLTGCLSPIVAPTTPTGSQNITVSFATTGGTTTTTHTLTYNFTVTKP